MKKISVIIPCFQNADNIPDLISALTKLNDELKSSFDLQVLFVDDGSTDDTYNELLERRKGVEFDSRLIKLSGNFGSYNAFLAGLNYSDGDCFVQLHADLQDPPEHIPEMIQYWQRGIKLVIGQRVSREGHWSNHLFSGIYHWLIRKLAMPFIPSGGYDLVLFDKQLKDEIVKMNERNTNLVYLISWLRFPYATVPLTRRVRKKGKSQWSFMAKRKLFIDSFVSFSYTPIIFVSTCAFIAFIVWLIISFLYLAGSMSMPFFNWILLTLITFLFVNIAIVAEYLWRTLEVARNRPPFVVDKIID